MPTFTQNAPAVPERRILLQSFWQSGVILLIAVFLGLSVNALRPHPLSPIRQPAASPAAETAADEDLFISFPEAALGYQTNQAIFVDARSEADFLAGHIAGARHFPVEQLDQGTPPWLADVPRDAMIIAYCSGEHCPLSKEVALELRDWGYSGVRVLHDGWNQWLHAGLPVEGG